MATGDGLLARLMPAGTMMLDAMAGLAAAARRHGNGILEITSRGSIQIRGLSDRSACDLADAVARLGIAAHDGIPIIGNPLTGLDPDELIDASALAAALRVEIAARGFAERLAPKVSVAIDGGGALHLDAFTADVRLRAVAAPDGPRLHVALGGDAASAAAVGTAAIADAVGTVVRLLDAIAARGREARGRDVAASVAANASAPPPRAAADPIGTHRLRDGGAAAGIGFAFGHTDAATLEELVGAARACGATGFRTAPGRAVLAIGLAAERVEHFRHAAGQLGFLVDPGDIRRRVVACAGAPVCAAAEIPARTLAPQVTARAAPLLRRGEVIHISGCPKGCAHHAQAALTAIGRGGQCDLLIGDAPAGRCESAALPQRLGALAAARSARHG
jgi:precorrin-3B synthase